MKLLILALMVSAPVVGWSECRFSNQASEHKIVTPENCGEKFCMSVVVCDGQPKVVTCKSKNGTCDGYSANDCVASAAAITEDAQFNASGNPTNDGRVQAR